MQAANPYHSFWVDIGGFVCGLAPCFLFLAGPADERCSLTPMCLQVK